MTLKNLLPTASVLAAKVLVRASDGDTGLVGSKGGVFVSAFSIFSSGKLGLGVVKSFWDEN